MNRSSSSSLSYGPCSAAPAGRGGVVGAAQPIAPNTASAACTVSAGSTDRNLPDRHRDRHLNQGYTYRAVTPPVLEPALHLQLFPVPRRKPVGLQKRHTIHKAGMSIDEYVRQSSQSLPSGPVISQVCIRQKCLSLYFVSAGASGGFTVLLSGCSPSTPRPRRIGAVWF